MFVLHALQIGHCSSLGTPAFREGGRKVGRAAGRSTQSMHHPFDSIRLLTSDCACLQTARNGSRNVGMSKMQTAGAEIQLSTGNLHCGRLGTRTAGLLNSFRRRLRCSCSWHCGVCSNVLGWADLLQRMLASYSKPLLRQRLDSALLFFFFFTRRNAVA